MNVRSAGDSRFFKINWPSIAWLVGAVCLLQTPRLTSQVIYFNNTFGQIFTFDIATCTATQISPNGVAFNDMAVGDNGIVYGLFGQSIWELDTNTGLVSLFGTYPTIISPTLEYADGQLYLVGLPGTLFQISTSTGVSQNLGNLPAGWNSLGDLVVLDGNFYGTFATSTGTILANVNVAAPGTSTVVGPLPADNLIGGASVNNATCPKMYWFNTIGLNGNSTLWEYDVNTQTWAQKCPGLNFTIGGADSANDYSFPVTCSCSTDAGNVTPATFEICGTSATVSVPFTGGEVLEADDVLRYILFEDADDPVGSILAQSTSPIFGFDAGTMQLGQTYFLASIAGNNLSGNVDLDDPCLSVSDSALVAWFAVPTVLFSPGSTVCAGQCFDVSLSFTGTPPFNLTIENPFSGQQSLSFADNNGIVEICPPLGTPTGDLTLQALALSDANCACP